MHVCIHLAFKLLLINVIFGLFIQPAAVPEVFQLVVPTHSPTRRRTYTACVRVSRWVPPLIVYCFYFRRRMDFARVVVGLTMMMVMMMMLLLGVCI